MLIDALIQVDSINESTYIATEDHTAGAAYA